MASKKTLDTRTHYTSSFTRDQLAISIAWAEMDDDQRRRFRFKADMLLHSLGELDLKDDL